MTRLLALGFCASALGLAPAGEGGKADSGTATEFSGSPRVPANTGFSFNISPDKQAMTVLFDNLVQEVGPASKGQAGTLGQTASQAKVFTLEVPYSTDLRSVRMAMDLRGYASADGDACVKVIAHAGDATKVVDVFGSSGGKAGAPVQLKGKAKEKLAGVAGPAKGKSNDFQQRVEFTLQVHAARPVCQVTLVLLAEHDTDTPDSGAGVVMIDSLDLSFTTAGQGKYER